MNQDKTFYEYNFNGGRIAFHKDAVICVQVGKDKGKYETKYTFEAQDFGRAVLYYNGINIGRGFKKRLFCETLNKPTLHKVRS